jgi:hypothetical protein
VRGNLVFVRGTRNIDICLVLCYVLSVFFFPLTLFGKLMVLCLCLKLITSLRTICLLER